MKENPILNYDDWFIEAHKMGFFVKQCNCGKNCDRSDRVCNTMVAVNDIGQIKGTFKVNYKYGWLNGG